MKQTNKPVILVDMDQTIADCQSEWLQQYNYHFDRRYGDFDYATEDLQNKVWDIGEYVTDKEMFYQVLRDEGFFSSLGPLTDDTVEYFSKLYHDDRFQTFILTTDPYDSVTAVYDKRQWMKDYFPDFDIRKNMFFAYRKEHVKGSILVDDKLKHLVNWKNHNPGGFTISLTYPWLEGHEPHVQAKNWKEVYETIIDLYESGQLLSFPV